MCPESGEVRRATLRLPGASLTATFPISVIRARAARTPAARRKGDA